MVEKQNFPNAIILPPKNDDLVARLTPQRQDSNLRRLLYYSSVRPSKLRNQVGLVLKGFTGMHAVTFEAKYPRNMYRNMYIWKYVHVLPWSTVIRSCCIEETFPDTLYKPSKSRPTSKIMNEIDC